MLLFLVLFDALADAMPITTEDANSHRNPPESFRVMSRKLATGAVDLARRSVCEVDPDTGTTIDCPPVHSVLRAILAVLLLFVFLVLLHVWQAAKYNKIHAVFGAYVDDTQSSAKPDYILLEEPNSP
ncbi:hypothetical protein ISF_05970 [Cordyceps fumosorosea ARSEF 2679]|uniref:Uncharacterized protein n=1 Tax=Cordyceps fumosorosea (strain ARSEF 2679) TaxID=1081104 RepID=A0A167SVA0_CORFA|nr:hypothetical protein ISF_05970 [Cordyceps fumosorosea ARSEF 2679]OAA59959.1 hypothetical protein ISF_05970 [Cordyceps fumosorosea ARSEF 2679]